ncbi:DUF1624 domain-containing protein [Glaciihabitans arcticus]|uniref:DUF1624 domain-containing protein n=1 Tax=Glaciihabitans arcticus TaxID=2668039 RepID=A0A4Q9GMY1_9MICO|nr:heparan-alpha-glucosaminide N-acetyltransferase domain-containing protein [Glaciihabitans arcticus]TBN56152.1 DUF1624 domain-containing protein [Glaciihabitans arcticus]
MTTAEAVAEASWRVSVKRRLRAYGSPGTSRIIGIDIARGLAVLGMFAAHIGITENFDWGTPSTWLDVVNGRSSILFAVLAGVSIALISGRRVPLEGVPLLQARTRIFTRAVLIFAIGGVLEFLGTGVAVILPMYALLFVLSLPFLRWKPWMLFTLAGVLALVMPFLQLVLTLVTSTSYTSSAFITLLVSGTYPGMIWIVFLLTGLGVGRLDLAAKRTRLVLLGTGLVLAIVGYGIGALGDALSPEPPGSSSSSSSSSSGEIEEGVPAKDLDLDGLVCDDYGDGFISCYPPDFSGPIDEGVTAPEDEYGIESLGGALGGLLSARPHSGTTTEVMGSTGFALCVIVLCLFAAGWRGSRWALYPIAATGSMALTAYSVHVFAISFLGEAAWENNTTLGWFIAGALVLCSAWAVCFGRGPLERLLSDVSRQAASFAEPRDEASGTPSLESQPQHSFGESQK